MSFPHFYPACISHDDVPYLINLTNKSGIPIYEIKVEDYVRKTPPPGKKSAFCNLTLDEIRLRLSLRFLPIKVGISLVVTHNWEAIMTIKNEETRGFQRYDVWS